MKIAATISRYLLGLLFTIFGANGFLHFIPQPPPVSPLAIQYMTVMSQSHYFVLVFLLQLIAGILLLSGYFVPLALALLAPILVNILEYHVLMAPEGIAVGLVATVLWFVVFLNVRGAFAGVFAAKSPAVQA